MKNSSAGNVLFLILIAVALFAALSYAVTRSNRTGTGNASDESLTVNVATLSQFTSSVRTAVQRIIVSGTPITRLQFNQPQNLASCTSPSMCVFHNQGGGIPYQNPAKNLMNRSLSYLGSAGDWMFTLGWQVIGVGTDAVPAGQDLMAILIGISELACRKVNQKLGISGMPEIEENYMGEDLVLQYDNYYMDHDYIYPGGNNRIIGGLDSPALKGQQEGCFYESDTGVYVYYSVLYPR